MYNVCVLKNNRLATVVSLFILTFHNNVQAAKPIYPLSWTGYAVGEDVSNLHGGIREGSIFTIAGKIVAEGVEAKVQLEFLLNNNCEIA